MRFSLLALLFMIGYLALAIFSIVDLGRIPAAKLFTVTFIPMLLGIVYAINTSGTRRAFFVSFTATSFLVMFLLGSYPPREFYSLPAVGVEWAIGAEDFYGDWGYAENIPYANEETGISQWRLDNYLRHAGRRRVRFIANTMFAGVFGLFAGLLGQHLYSKSNPGTTD